MGLPAALPVINFGNLAEKFRILVRVNLVLNPSTHLAKWNARYPFDFLE